MSENVQDLNTLIEGFKGNPEALARLQAQAGATTPEPPKPASKGKAAGTTQSKPPAKPEAPKADPKPAAAPLTLEQQIAALMAENERLKTTTTTTTGLSFRVSEKGAVSVYGTGRFPTTLYQEQWLKVLDNADEIRAFIKANAASLSTKGDK
jgi:hypothetical protein